MFTTLIYQPLFNLFVWLADVLPGHDAGVAIIALTIIIKVVLYPLSASSIQSQKKMQELQPKIDELKAKHKDDKQALAQATMQMYKDNKVSPFSSCLPLLIQLPVLLALYRVILHGLNGEGFDLLYSFVQNPHSLQPTAFGLLNLTEPSILLAALAGLGQFFQARQLNMTRPPIKTEGSKDENMMAQMNKNMMYFMPVLTVVIGMRLPGGLALYWLVNTLLQIGQQWWIFRRVKSAE